MDQTDLGNDSPLALLDTELRTGLRDTLFTMGHYMQIRYQIRLRGPLAVAALMGVDAPGLGRETLSIVDAELHHPALTVLSTFMKRYDRYVKSSTSAEDTVEPGDPDPAFAKYKADVLSNLATLKVHIQDLVMMTARRLQANTAGKGFEPESYLESTYLEVGGIVAGDLGWIILVGIDELKEAVERAGRREDQA